MLQLIVLIIGFVCGTLLTRECLFGLWLLAWVVFFIFRFLYRRWRCNNGNLSNARCCQWWLLLFCIASAYSHVWLSWQLQHRLALEHDQIQVHIEGVVRQVQLTELGQRFILQVTSVSSDDALVAIPRRVQLNHYQRGESQAVHFAQGDALTLVATLRSPRNFANGLPFDYEAFLLSQGIDATGYVRSLINQQPDVSTNWRQRWLLHLQQHRRDDVWPWIAGLVFAEQGAFSDDLWQLTQTSGTVHLLVVSGLHVGWVALLGLLIGRFAVRVIALVRQRTPMYMPFWPMMGLVVALTLYWTVAQPGVSLQRATWMVFFAALYVLWLRRVSPSLIVLAAAAMMLLLNPMIYTRTGFVFSVLAVWSLLHFFDGRRSTRLGLLWWPQWVVFAALMPIMLWWQNPVNVGHLVANAVAIPWLTFVMLPLTFLHTVFDVRWLADAVQWNAEWFLRAQYSFQAFSWPTLGWQSSVLLCLWWLWLWLLVRGVHFMLGVVGTVLILVLWWQSSVYPMPFTEPRITLVDVGQGLSVLVTGNRMHSHQQQALVYDVGPRFSARFDAGSGMVLPLLQRQRIQYAHSLIVSHNHADHYGGAPSLIAGIPVQRIWQGQALRTPLQHADQAHRDWQLCHAHSEWQVLSIDWRFRFFPIENHRRNRTNNHSCVVLLEWYGTRILLMGDLERDAELWLAAHYGSALQADVLVVGHHGSRTSTTDALLNVVMPTQAWISTGFNNRFQHPHKEVTERLQQQGIVWYSTANDGALSLSSSGQLTRQRQLRSPAWRQR